MQNAENMQIRDLDLAKDMDAIKRIWREIGWADDERIEKAMDICYAVGHTSVATIADEVECAVETVPGVMRLQQTDLPLCVVAAVTTSRIGRGLSLAQQLTARELALAAERGEVVASLGMFDQGFYDKLGFGTGAYHNEFAFDPATLTLDKKIPTPRRLEVEDFAVMHQAIMARPLNHGGVAIGSPEFFHAGLAMSEDAFGLGFDTDGQLSHFLWVSAKNAHGPYRVEWLGYQNGEQLLELLALLKSLSDQLYSVRMMEPPEVQLQSLLRRPFRAQAIADDGKHAAAQEAYAWYQLRVLDVPSCVAAVTWQGKPIRFQLSVQDPVGQILQDRDGWQGVQGRYVVELGSTSVAEQREDSSLPVLDCSVNALSRLLWGVVSASSLQLTDQFAAPPALVSALDRIFTERPHPFWDF